MFYAFIFFDDFGDCLSGFFEMPGIFQVLLVVVCIDLFIVEFRKFFFHLLKFVTYTGIVGQAKKRVLLANWGSVTDTVLKALCVPMHEFKILFLTQNLYVTIDIRKRNFSPHYKPHS